MKKNCGKIMMNNKQAEELEKLTDELTTYIFYVLDNTGENFDGVFIKDVTYNNEKELLNVNYVIHHIFYNDDGSDWETISHRDIKIPFKDGEIIPAHEYLISNRKYKYNLELVEKIEDTKKMIEVNLRALNKYNKDIEHIGEEIIKLNAELEDFTLKQKDLLVKGSKKTINN